MLGLVEELFELSGETERFGLDVDVSGVDEPENSLQGTEVAVREWR
jgi:hypothetical protein